MKKFFASTVAALAMGAVFTISQVKPAEASSRQAVFTLPKGYTKANLKKAYKYSTLSSSQQKKWLKNKKNVAWLKKWRKINVKGMQVNTFDQSALPESSKDDKTIVKLTNGHLTTSQSKTLAVYSLRLINQARVKMGLKKWKYSKGTQKLALEISKEYVANKKTIATGHYVPGIVRATKRVGLKLPGNYNYVEDMAGFKDGQKLTMTAMKKDIYFGLKTMMFGYRYANQSKVTQLSQYTEWEHAGDLMNTQGGKYDGDWDYYGFNVSYTNGTYSMHYIGVPSHLKWAYGGAYWGSFKA
ncbi:SEC10/PgrA surface exclusion domain-containing protein [Lactobacillus sp.]|uniref:SEC10/PgrA surface exclusion domain-containing protein n=1 Tax=Lactobacillus sp. TaxID=1591 RepID=UPI003EFC79BF